MPSVFTMIINGDLPARFVWQDDQCVAFLSIAPLAPGHTLVVPRAEIDHWIDADDELMAHLTGVARRIGVAQQAVFNPRRVALMVVGDEVPHLHIHVIPFTGMHNIDFANAEADPDPAALDDVAERLSAALDG